MFKCKFRDGTVKVMDGRATVFDLAECVVLHGRLDRFERVEATVRQPRVFDVSQVTITEDADF